MHPVERNIHIPAQPARQNVLTNLGTGEKQITEIPPQPAGTKKFKVERYLHLGNSQNVQLIVAALRESTTVKALLKSIEEPEGNQPPISMLVIWEPDGEAGDLDGLPELQKQCPQLHVVIFHRVSEKYEVLKAEVEKHRKDGKLSLQAIDRLLDITKAIVELTGVRKPVSEKLAVTHRAPIQFNTVIVPTRGSRGDHVKGPDGWKWVADAEVNKEPLALGAGEEKH